MINKVFMSAIVGVALTAAAVLSGSAAQAAIITNHFRVDVTMGLLEGQSFFGHFTYNDAALSDPAIQIIDPSNGNQIINQSNGLIDLSFNFLNNTYTQASDSGFPDYPTINFAGGSLQSLDYIVESLLNPGPIRSFVIAFDPLFGGPVFNGFDGSPFNPNSNGLLAGPVTYDIQPIPTPALLPGLIGLSVGVLRKRRSATQAVTVDS
ncbi:MAG: PTPA-CTERM sorting domain-containing protein [Leptolyngbyaceae cyanobacterium bins.302]|nr:PTPA-CTERM sorting domain-containing protein [Leptolyngbyaceae cyanobacterium bins.302]